MGIDLAHVGLNVTRHIGMNVFEIFFVLFITLFSLNGMLYYIENATEFALLLM